MHRKNLHLQKLQEVFIKFFEIGFKLSANNGKQLVCIFFICITLSDKNVDEIKFWDSLLSYSQSGFKDNIYFYPPFIFL